MIADHNKENFRYRRISTQMYGDEKFRALSKPKANGQTLWVYLLTNPHGTVIPGVFSIGEAALAEALGWSLSAFRRCWAELSSKQMAMADWTARLVFIPNALRHNLPTSPNVIRGWSTSWRDLPDCALKTSAAAQIAETLSTRLGKASAQAFDVVIGRAPIADKAKQGAGASDGPAEDIDKEPPRKEHVNTFDKGVVEGVDEGVDEAFDKDWVEGGVKGFDKGVVKVVVNSRERERSGVRTFEGLSTSTNNKPHSPAAGVCVPNQSMRSGTAEAYGSNQSPRRVGFSPPVPASSPRVVTPSGAPAQGHEPPPTPEEQERAAAFVSRYTQELYPKWRYGTPYRSRGSMDYYHATQLVRYWPDDRRLDLMAELFLRTDESFAEKGSRTLGQFLAMAEWCDARLRKNGK